VDDTDDDDDGGGCDDDDDDDKSDDNRGTADPFSSSRRALACKASPVPDVSESISPDRDDFPLDFSLYQLGTTPSSSRILVQISSMH